MPGEGLRLSSKDRKTWFHSSPMLWLNENVTIYTDRFLTEKSHKH